MKQTFSLALVWSGQLKLVREDVTERVRKVFDFSGGGNQNARRGYGIFECGNHARGSQCFDVSDNDGSVLCSASESPLHTGLKNPFRLHVASCATFGEKFIRIDVEGVQAKIRC